MNENNKREYNSERRRKLIIIYNYSKISTIIRENITPRGDGNNILAQTFASGERVLIRENITPRGDGNLWLSFHYLKTRYKREYNSERRRKPNFFESAKQDSYLLIRENITPRGDGNVLLRNMKLTF